MAFRIWFAFSFLFLIHNLIHLVNDSYLIGYKTVEKGDKLYDNHTNYLICTPSLDVKDNDHLKIKIQNVSIKNFLNYSISSIEHRLNTTDLFHLNESYLFFDEVCFLINKEELEKKVPLHGYLEIYLLSLFIFSNGKQPAFNEYVYEKLDDLSSIYLKTFKEKVYGKKYLTSSSKCLTYADQLTSNKLHCLNKCFTNLKIKQSFYNVNDDEKFDFDRIENLPQTNQTIQQIDDEKEIDILTFYGINKDYKSCLTKCPENDCFWETYNTIVISKTYYDEYLLKENKAKIDLQTNIYLAYYMMNDFYAQLFGLIALFTNATMVDLSTKIINWLAKKIIYQRKHRRYVVKYLRFILKKNFKFILSKITLITILISLVFVLIQSGFMISDYRFNSKYPNKTSSLTYSSEPFSTVICFAIVERNAKILKSSHFSEIEKNTNFTFKEKFKTIEIYYAFNKISFDWTVSKKGLFKNSTFNNQIYLSRCYRVEIEIKELKYKNILPLATLKLEFNTSYWQVYLIEKNKPFTSNLINFKGVFYARKRSIISSKISKKSNCVNYFEKTNLKCLNKKHCIDRCINAKFYEKYNSLTIHSVLEKDELESEFNLTNINLNETKDKGIENDCIDSFNQPDCIDILFEESLEHTCQQDEYSLSIKLNYENLKERELEQTLIKLVLDLMNLLSIFFGLNAIGILLIIISYLKNFLKLNWHKIFKILVLVVCLICFLLHFDFIFRNIIEGELIKNEYFEKSNEYNLPNTIFCFKYNHSEIDKNIKISGEYLDQLTSDLTFKSVFKIIKYYNRTYFKYLNINKLNYTANSKFYSNSEISLTHFYYIKLKCFEIILKTSFKEENFYFLDVRFVLHLYLNDRIYRQYQSVYFLYRERESKQIGGSFLYRIGAQSNDNKHIYDIEFQLTVIVREDWFEFFKNPRSLIYDTTTVNDATKYLETMKKKFKNKHGLTSRDTILDHDFKLEIDDLLFKQFYLQIKNRTNHNGLISLNYKQNVYNTYSQAKVIPLEVKNFEDFRFSLSLISRHVDIFNEDNFTKLIISILNAISFWLGLCILDLSVYVRKLFRPILHFYQMLIKVKVYLHLRIKINLIPQNPVTKFAFDLLDAIIL